MKHNRTHDLVILAILTAVVVILQFIGAQIRFGPFSVSLVLIPIVVGAALVGPVAGLWLGLVFGAVVLLSGDAAFFMGYNPFGTVVTVLVKGAMAGLLSGFVFKALEQKNRYGATIVSAVTCPVVNTGIFLLGCVLFFIPAVKDLAVMNGYGEEIVKFMFVGLVGLNFVFELLINVILSPVIIRLVDYARKH